MSADIYEVKGGWKAKNIPGVTYPTKEQAETAYWAQRAKDVTDNQIQQHKDNEDKKKLENETSNEPSLK